MILINHLLMGAAMGSAIGNPFLAVVLAFFSHYFLDFFPHIEYSIANIRNKQWSKAKKEFLDVFVDFFSGVLLIALFSKNQPIIYICAFIAIIPDGLSFLGLILDSNLLKAHSFFHRQKAHFFNNKKAPCFWRFFCQIAAAIAAIVLLKL